MTRTELHTHFMGMLSSKGFINLLKHYNYDLSMDHFMKIIKNFPLEDRRYFDYVLASNGYNIEMLFSIDENTQIPYDYLNDVYALRTFILRDVMSNNSDEVLVKYLSDSLIELSDQGVKYVEISYSNYNNIEYMLKNFDFKSSDVKFKFLLSLDRHKRIKDVKQFLNKFKKLTDFNNSDNGKVVANNVVGIDVMGLESALAYNDLDVNNKTGLLHKLKYLVEELEGHKYTLRIHSGETRECSENTYQILDMLNDLLIYKDDKPEIRIGHGIYYNRDKRYYDLLKQLECVVEICASSNYALSNIDYTSDLPYNDYVNHGIPVVISSDGHGVYSTYKMKEDMICKNNTSSYNYDKINDDDIKILNNKTRR